MKKEIQTEIDRIAEDLASQVFGILQKHYKSGYNWATCGPITRAACREIGAFIIQSKFQLIENYGAPKKEVAARKRNVRSQKSS